MASEWYYAQDGRQHGPVASRELKQLADSGSLQPDDLVWKDGMPDWVPAGEVKGLIGERAAEPSASGSPLITPTEDGVPLPRRRRSRSQMAQGVLIVTAVAMISAMFMPWWSLRLVVPSDDAEEQKGKWATAMAVSMHQPESAFKAQLRIWKDPDRQPTFSDEKARRKFQDAVRFYEVASRNKRWWDEHLKSGDASFAHRFEDAARKVDDNDRLSLTMRIWGWNEGIAIMGLVFGLLIMVLAIVFVSVPVLRNWSWTISIVATIMGAVTLILSLIWLIKAPGADVPRLLAQGTIIGPYLLLASGVVFFVVGLFDTIFGISYVVRAARLR